MRLQTWQAFKDVHKREGSNSNVAFTPSYSSPITKSMKSPQLLCRNYRSENLNPLMSLRAACRPEAHFEVIRGALGDLAENTGVDIWLCTNVHMSILRRPLIMRKFLTVAVSEDEYTRFQEESRSKGQSISARVRELLGFRDDPVTDLVQDMIKRVSEYPLIQAFRCGLFLVTRNGKRIEAQRLTLVSGFMALYRRGGYGA
jgi:hypothetical protein